MTDSNIHDKLRAVFLTALMIGSVFGAGIAFTGGAAAAANTLSATGDTTLSAGDTVNFDVDNSTNTPDSIQVWVDVNGDGFYNTSEPHTTVSVQSGDTVESGSIELPSDLAEGSYDLAANQTSSLSAGISAEDTAESAFDVDNTDPVYNGASPTGDVTDNSTSFTVNVTDDGTNDTGVNSSTISVTVTDSAGVTHFDGEPDGTNVTLDGDEITVNAGNNWNYAEGPVNITVTAADEAGNSNQSTFEFFVDAYRALDVTPENDAEGAQTKHNITYEVNSSFEDPVKDIVLDYEETDIQSVGDLDLTLNGEPVDGLSVSSTGDGTTDLRLEFNEQDVSDGDVFRVFSGSDEFVNPSNTGDYNLTIEAQDSNENILETAETTLNIGTDANPTVERIELEDSPINTSNNNGQDRQVTIVFSEDVASVDAVEYSNFPGSPSSGDITSSGDLNGDTWNGTFSLQADSGADQNMTISVDATDDGENDYTANDSHEFIVDTQPPNVTANTSDEISGNSYDVSTEFEFENVGADTEVTYEYNSGNGFETIETAGDFNTSNVDDGDLMLRATAVDDAGNTDSDSGTTVVDNNGPSVEATLSSDTVVTETVDLTDAFSASNTDGNEVAYYLNETGGTEYTELSSDVLDTTTYDDGTISLKANVTDDASNTDSASVNVIVDNTDPVVDITSPTEVQYNRTGDVIDVEWDLTEDNLDYVNVTLADGNGNNVTYESTDGEGLTLENGSATTSNGEGLTNGTYDVTVTAYDDVGQTGTDTEAGVLEVDDLSPGELDIETPSSEVVTDSDSTLDIAYDYYENNTQTVVVTLNSSDATYNYTVDDSQYVNDHTRKSLAIDLNQTDDGEVTLEDGAYSVNITVTDSVGNENSTETSEAYVVINDNSASIDGVSVDESGTVVRPGDNVSVTYDYNDQVNGTIEFDLYQEVDGEDNVHIANLGSTEVEPTDNIDEKLEVSEVDGEDYYVQISSTNEFEEEAVNQTETFTVNQELPEITSIKTNAGTDTAVVEFNEDVYATGDSEFTVDDFAYQDVNGVGADAIEDVSGENGTHSVTLDLNGTVQASALETDLINARMGQIEDSAGAQVGTEAVALNDTTPPTLTESDITLEEVNVDNADSYAGVSIDVEEEVNVTVSATENSSINATYSNVAPGDAVPLTGPTLDLSNLSDSATLSLTVEVEDLSVAGYIADATETVEKDTVKPHVESATTNAGTDTITVTLNEPVTDAGFELTNASVATDDTVGDDATDTVYTVTTVNDVQPSDIDNASVQLNATAGTDDVENTVNSSVAVNLTDDEVPYFDEPAYTSNNETEVTVSFSEQVFNASGENLTVENFTYVNESGQSNEIVGVDYDESTQTATLTLSESVTGDHIGDHIESDAVDSVGHSVANTATIQTGFYVSEFEVTNPSDRVVRVNFTADEPIESFDVHLNSQDSTTHELTDTYASLNESDFEITETQAEDGDYEYVAETTVPRDGEYEVDASDFTAVGDEGTHSEFGSYVDVDSEAPSVIDSEIISYDGDTTIAVQFSEPVDDAGDLEENISIDGVSPYSITDVDETALEDNEVTVDVNGAVQTGDSPDVSFDAGTFEETAGDSSSNTGDETTVNTLEQQLSAGPNFVSLPAASGEIDVSTVVSELGGESNVNSIMTYDGGSWQSYNPTKPADEQDFESIEGGQGYIVDLSESAELEVNVNNVVGGDSAQEATPQSQQLEEGWNLVGQWQEGTQGPGHALTTLGDARAHSTAVYEQAEAGSYTYGQPDVFHPGEAYWVFVNEDTDYTEAQFGA